MKKSICLCMIVRNEAAILDRCLASVRGLIDSWIICDTGSTDGTQELVRSSLSHLPGELHELTWIDFGHNRTELMERAHGKADYLLALDADMTVRLSGPLPDLTLDAYLIRDTGTLDYGVLRLVRGDRRWWYSGSTHEHLATDGRFEQGELEVLTVEHHADGSARPEKLIRDLGLLRRDLARSPNAPRATFYLAQTLKELGEREAAIDAYRQRVELGGWDEEVFYANLVQGMLVAQEDVGAATSILLEAWERRPARAEPLYELARIHRRRGDFSMAHMFASRGMEIPYPADVLFVHREVYGWGLRLERGLAAAGLGWEDEARDDLHELVTRTDTPDEVRQAAGRQLGDLQRAPEAVRVSALGPEAGAVVGERSPAATLTALAPGTRIGEIKLDVEPAWPCFNPSIASDGDGFRMIVRTANYEIGGDIFDEDGVLRTINYLIELDSDLAVRTMAPLVDRTEQPKRYPTRVEGYEDCRLFQCDNTWYATATVCDLNPDERREVALLRLEGAEIVEVTALAGPHGERHEKNWMPLSLAGVPHVLYSCAPTALLRCDPHSGGTEMIARHDAPAEAHHLRGGSQGVPYDGGHLFVVHEVDRSGPAARYLHRLLALGPDHSIMAMSRPFSFIADRVEFCAGMALRDETLVLSFGVSDVAAGLAIVPLAQALALLEPIAHVGSGAPPLAFDTPPPIVSDDLDAASSLSGHFEGAALQLSWTPPPGVVERYELELNGEVVASYDGSETVGVLRRFDPSGTSRITLRAIGPGGQRSEPTAEILVMPALRPTEAPDPAPAWANALLAWEEQPPERRGERPAVPSPLPDWYPRWRNWRRVPFRFGVPAA
ncbi:MAG TPA: glycosyltransferase [Solirubrobacteraceae bacterium]|jgi:tetratricopeptide (TPR) repeat protein